jgi:rfaE bifunctional protein kinase chain/domain
MKAPSPTPTPARLLEIIDGMADQPVLMLVDLVADRFITGVPKRISREAPVLILRFEDEALIPGGGANAVANVRALGGHPLPVGVVGDDGNGRGLLDLLAERGIATEGIRVQPGYRTPTKTRILGGGRHSIKQQIVRYDIEDSLPWDAAMQEDLEARLTGFDGRASVAVLSDYGYGAVRPDLMAPARQALGHGSCVLCDSRYRLAEFIGLDGATPNEEEAEALAGGPLPEGGRPLETEGRRLLERLQGRFLLITRGSRGMALFQQHSGTTHLPVHGTDQVADVTGAGDTVIGTFALATAAGATPLEAALLANYAGGVVVMKMGTATLTRQELQAAVTGDPTPMEDLKWVE